MNAHDVSILDEGASLSGRLTGQDLMIAGSFEGELTLSGRLTLGPGARVKAKVRAEVVEIEGQFDGEIRAKSLTFAPTAKARGLFLSDRLGIREGATVEGSFNPAAAESDNRRAARHVAPPAPPTPMTDATPPTTPTTDAPPPANTAPANTASTAIMVVPPPPMAAAS